MSRWRNLEDNVLGVLICSFLLFSFRKSRTYLRSFRCVSKGGHVSCLCNLTQLPLWFTLNSFFLTWSMLLLIILHVLILMNARMSNHLNQFTGTGDFFMAHVYTDSEGKRKKTMKKTLIKYSPWPVDMHVTVSLWCFPILKIGVNLNTKLSVQLHGCCFFDVYVYKGQRVAYIFHSE